MSLNIGDALSTGAEKLTTTAGIQLGVIYVVLQLLTAVGTNSAISSIDTSAGTSGMATPALSLPLGVAGGAVLAALGGILNVALTIVVFRTLAHDTADLGSIPTGVTDNMLKTWVFLVVAMIIQTLIIGGGYIVLAVLGVAGILPALAVLLGIIVLIPLTLFLLVSLIFTQVYVTVEDEGPLQALSSSWALAKGNRFPLFGLGVILFVISLLVSIPTAIVALLSPVVGSVLNYVVSGFVTIFSWAVLVAAYEQLSSETSTTEPESTDGVDRTDDDSGFDYA